MSYVIVVDLVVFIRYCAADSVRARLLIFHPGSHFNFWIVDAVDCAFIPLVWSIFFEHCCNEPCLWTVRRTFLRENAPRD